MRALTPISRIESSTLIEWFLSPFLSGILCSGLLCSALLCSALLFSGLLFGSPMQSAHADNAVQAPAVQAPAIEPSTLKEVSDSTSPVPTSRRASAPSEELSSDTESPKDPLTLSHTTPSPLDAALQQATKPRASSPLDRAVLKVEIAETTYSLDASIENRGALLMALERVVELKCMPRLLVDLQFSGGLGNEECMEYVRKVFAIDSASPIAFCARDGIDSKNCLDASRNVVVGPFGEPYRVSDTDPRRPGTRATIADSSAVLLAQAKALRAALKGKEGLQNKLKMRALFNRLLVINCSVTRLALREAPPVQAQDQAFKDHLLSQPLPQNVPVEKYVDALVKGADKGEAAGDQGSYGPAHYRMRQISEACMYFVKEALSAEKDMATAICHREGFPTPQCIEAVRKERSSTFAEVQQARMSEGLPTLSPQEAQQNMRPGSRGPANPGGNVSPGFSTF